MLHTYGVTVVIACLLYLSNALKCHQCTGTSTIIFSYLEEHFGNVAYKNLLKHSLCNDMDDLGELKTCNQGNVCHMHKLKIHDNWQCNIPESAFKSNFTLRFCGPMPKETENVKLGNCITTMFL